MPELSHAITRADTRRHPHPDGDETWQESFFLGWVDVRNKAAGHHHISLCPQLKIAHVWTWLIVDGEEVARSQEHALPLPDHDLRDMTLGVLRYLAGESIRELRLAADFGNASLDVEYQAYIDPVHVDINSGSLKLGGAHYESMGAVHGAVKLGEREIRINGGGWQDHSWGSRRLSSNPAGRWVFAIFGSDLAVSVYALAGTAGLVVFGYVIDHGATEQIADAETRFTVGDDGVSPTGCEVTVWTRSGRGYHRRGAVLGTALVGGPGWAGDGEHVWMDGFTRFEHGGRIGGGIIEVKILKPTDEHRRVLRLG